jgi:hypothetical protein
MLRLEGFEVVGANGFEPSTSWSRTMKLNSINASSGVAYGTRGVISPLLVVPNSYPDSQNAVRDDFRVAEIGSEGFLLPLLRHAGAMRIRFSARVKTYTPRAITSQCASRITFPGPHTSRRRLHHGQPENVSRNRHRRGRPASVTTKSKTPAKITSKCQSSPLTAWPPKLRTGFSASKGAQSQIIG